MTYFEFYEIPESLEVDAKLAKSKFFENSRKYHPDFFVNESDEKQQEALELSTLNTNAFNTFKSSYKTLEYILKLNDLIVENYQLSPDFLMEMMEINEQLMDLEFDPDPAKLAVIGGEVDEFSKDLEASIESIKTNYANLTDKTDALKTVQAYYYKRKYLNRIEDTIKKLDR